MQGFGIQHEIWFINIYSINHKFIYKKSLKIQKTKDLILQP